MGNYQKLVSGPVKRFLHMCVAATSIVQAGFVNVGELNRFGFLPAALFLCFITCSSLARADVEAVYQDSCAGCHGVDRLGASGPALIPDMLSGMRGSSVKEVILNGRFGTEMPAFAGRISPEDVEDLSSYLNAPLSGSLNWSSEQAEASRTMEQGQSLGNSPVWDADPFDITLIVDSGGNSISVLDGVSFEVLDRFETPPVLPGGLQFSSDGRFAFIASRNGWVQKYDLWTLESVGRVRMGLSSSAVALSRDGNWLAVANDLPNALTFLNSSDLSIAGIVPLVGKDEKPSRVSAMYLAAHRNRFVLALKDASEIWEVFYGPNPPFYGFVHDYRVEGPPNIEEPFPVRQIRRVDYLDGFFFDQTHEFIIGSSWGGESGFVVDLVIGQKVADLDLQGEPFPGVGAAWQHDDMAVMAAPQMSGNSISVIDTKSWKVAQRIETEGPGSFIRNHPNSPFIWADVIVGGKRNALHVIDKSSLEIVRTVRADTETSITDLAFTRDGQQVLVSLQGKDGALVAYDARSFAEKRRLQVQDPRGIYNVPSSMRRK